MVESGGLENRCGGNPSTEGSNPSPSASQAKIRLLSRTFAGREATSQPVGWVNDRSAEPSVPTFRSPAWCGGTLASRNNPGWDVRSPEHGRVEVKARSRQTSKHLNWWHVSHLDRDGFDYLVCLLFDVNGDVEGAWGLTVAEVRVHAHSTVTCTSGKRTTKLAIRGEWKQHADKITLSS